MLWATHFNLVFVFYTVGSNIPPPLCWQTLLWNMFLMIQTFFDFQALKHVYKDMFSIARARVCERGSAIGRRMLRPCFAWRQQLSLWRRRVSLWRRRVSLWVYTVKPELEVLREPVGHKPLEVRPNWRSAKSNTTLGPKFYCCNKTFITRRSVHRFWCYWCGSAPNFTLFLSG